MPAAAKPSSSTLPARRKAASPAKTRHTSRASHASHASVYLASASPRRAQLLDLLGVQHQPLAPAAGAEADAAEQLEAERAGEHPADYVQRVTLAKLRAARARLKARGLPEAPILCADTTVAVGRRILAKPADAADAARMLRLLSGRWHQVHTAVAVSHGRRNLLVLNTSRVCFAPLDEAVIQAYIASGEPFGKAGAYAIQGAIAGWVSRIDGSHSGIMGLPLHETTQLLQRAGVSLALAR